MTRKITATACALLILLSVHAMKPTGNDTPPMRVPAFTTPNASGLGLYGDVPVSLFTGTPSVEIPLYTVSYLGYDLPVRLSYHASGIRPAQHPGWVGLGWSLEAGGMITRRVRDLMDEMRFYADNYLGYYFNCSLLGSGSWATASFADSFADRQSYILDTEPDEYYFSVNGISGYFYLGSDSVWHVRSEHDVKVEVASTACKPPLSHYIKDNSGDVGVRTLRETFSGFELTDEDGIRYTFGNDSTSVEYSISFWAQGSDNWVPTAWMLTSVTLPAGQRITLKYGREPPVADLGFSLQELKGLSQDPDGMLSDETLADNISGSLLSPVYLSSITAGDTEVIFTRSVSQQLGYGKELLWKRFHRQGLTDCPPLPYLFSGNGNQMVFLDTMAWHQLDHIKVRDKGGLSPDFDVSLTYSASAGRRLTLQAVDAGSRHYAMLYNRPEKLPPYLSYRTDHWGYYNNPAAVNAPRINPADGLLDALPVKEADPDSMALGILTRITYPTGGYTRFEYEPHTFGKVHDRGTVTAAQGIAGGLRVRRIIDGLGDADSSEVVSHEYFYAAAIPQASGYGYESSGVLRYLPRYTHTIHVSDFNGHMINAKSYSAQSVTPASSDFTGRHIGYTHVIDRLPDGAYTRYTFSNFDTAGMSCLDTPCDYIRQYPYMTGIAPVSGREQDRGLLLEKREYDSGGTLKRKSTYTYSSDTQEASVRALYVREYIDDAVIGNGSLVSFYDVDCYRIFTYTKRLTGRIDREYGTSGSENGLAYNYQYNSQRLLSSEQCISPEHTTLTTYRYAADKVSGTNVYASMVQRHVLSPLVESSTSVTYPDNAVQQARHHFTHYTSVQTPAATFFVPCQEDEATGGVINPVAYYDSYDCAGHPTSVRNAAGDRTVYVWGYGHRFLVAVVENATAAQVEAVIGSLDSFAAEAVPDMEALASLRSALPSSLVTTCACSPLWGPVSLTDPSGKTTYYSYDSEGRLVSVQDHDHNLISRYLYKYHDLNDIPH